MMPEASAGLGVAIVAFGMALTPRARRGGDAHQEHPQPHSPGGTSQPRVSYCTANQ